MPILGIMASSITASTLGGYESIATVTVTSATQASIDFTSIPQTYQHLQIRLIARSDRDVAGSVESNIGVRVGNGSIDTGSNYAYHGLFGDGSSAGSFSSVSNSRLALGYITAFNATANQFGVAIIDILDYANTSKNSTFRCLTGVDRNGGGQVRLQSGLWMNTSAIDTIRLLDLNLGPNLVQHSSFALYGIK
jgi:hypothetical protein